MFVNAIMYYKVQDAIKAVTNVDDYAGSAQALAATTLRNVLGNDFYVNVCVSELFSL